MSPRTGRPKVEKPKGQRFSIRLDDETGNRLDNFCKRTGKKRAEVIREGIELVLKENEQ